MAIDEENMAAAGGDVPTYVPTSEGYAYKLPDGVTTSVRLRRVGERYVPQWAIANRKVVIPNDLNMSEMVPKLVERCSERPHRVLKLSDAARGLFMSYSTHFNILVKKARDSCDADAGAEYGISPWKLGMLAGSFFLWDVLWLVVTPAFREEDWVIQAEHVERAFRLMTILDGIRLAFRTNQAPQVEEEAGGQGEGDSPLLERDLPNCPQCRGARTTEIARRMLTKSTAQGDGGEYSVHTIKVWKLFTAKEIKARSIEVKVHTFREIAKACPPALGRYDADSDSLVFTVPSEPSDEYKDALAQYANMTPPRLASDLARVSTSGGARRKGAPVH